MQSPKMEEEDLYRFLTKLDAGKFSCSLCMKICNNKRDGRNHMEAIHFPGHYNCSFCGKILNSKNNLGSLMVSDVIDHRCKGENLHLKNLRKHGILT